VTVGGSALLAQAAESARPMLAYKLGMQHSHRLALTLCSLMLVVGSASAHDTWFALDGDGTLSLSTGNRFPVPEQGVDPQYFARSGCRAGMGAVRPLVKLRYTDTATVLRAPVAGTVAYTCFMQLQPFEFELPADKIRLYFNEIRPGAAVLAAWADLQARGLPFVEKYTKSARIDVGAVAAPTPTGTVMDVLRQAPAGTLAVGGEATFQVLREGRPLADFAVELINENSQVGLWSRTDAQGRITARLPLPGRWLLRGTDLRLSGSDPTRWESQFITYAFDVD
jgi:Domain of unknown function (DUF4198)